LSGASRFGRFDKKDHHPLATIEETSAMLAELSEADATGEIAEIYGEIRRLWAVPYVSSVYKHMATRPGLLPWAWNEVAPVFRDGFAQEAAWQAASQFELAPLAQIPRAALRVWGVDSRAEAKIGEICEGFVRVAPVNLVFAGLVRRILAGGAGSGHGEPRPSWTPPPDVPAPPAMVDPAKLSADERNTLLVFAKGVGETPFVPGLYRMLAHWPALLAHLATDLASRIEAPDTIAAYDELRRRLDEVADACLQRLPPRRGETRPAPDASERDHVLSVLDIYRRTSPEMVAFGRLIRDALPSAS
jgi:hypothetical protein